MTVEMALLISAVSVAFGIYFGITTSKRNSRIDLQNDAAQLTTIIVKLENINMVVTETKTEIFNLKLDFKEDHERLVRLEEAFKQLQQNERN